MNQTLKAPQLEMLQATVRGRCPELIERVRSTDVSGLNRQERELIVQALGHEFAASGLDENSEPTPRGLQLEDLLDIINRPNLK